MVGINEQVEQAEHVEIEPNREDDHLILDESDNESDREENHQNYFVNFAEVNGVVFDENKDGVRQVNVYENGEDDRGSDDDSDRESDDDSDRGSDDDSDRESEREFDPEENEENHQNYFVNFAEVNGVAVDENKDGVRQVNVYENGEEDVEQEDDNNVVNVDMILLHKQIHGDDIVNKFLTAILYSDIEIDDALDYLRVIALKYFTREEILEIPALFQKFKKSDKILIGTQLLALADNVHSRYKKSIIMYIFYYYIPKILRLLPFASGLRLLKVVLEKKEEFQKDSNLDYSELMEFENRNTPTIERILGTMLY
jgi:hypothetical protein